MMKIITITFSNAPRTYQYWAPDDAHITIGGRVVIDSPFNGYMLVEVVDMANMGPTPPATKLKRIVCAVDDTDYKVWAKTALPAEDDIEEEDDEDEDDDYEPDENDESARRERNGTP